MNILKVKELTFITFPLFSLHKELTFMQGEQRKDGRSDASQAT